MENNERCYYCSRILNENEGTYYNTYERDGNETLVCPECDEERLCQCDNCGNWFDSANNGHFEETRSLCPTCWENDSNVFASIKPEKENAKKDFLDMIKKSWTWERLSKRERNAFIESVKYADLTGTWEQRWKSLYAMYHTLLNVLDYEYIGWREKENGGVSF